jgi:hypothetical protein
VIQCRENPRFALESCEPLRIAGKRRRQDLESDIATEAFVASPIDLAHPARTDGGLNAIRAESNAGLERQSSALLYGRPRLGAFVTEIGPAGRRIV